MNVIYHDNSVSVGILVGSGPSLPLNNDDFLMFSLISKIMLQA